MTAKRISQTLAYLLVCAMAVFAVVRVQALSDAQVDQIRESQRLGCERTNDRTREQNAKFSEVYDLVGTIGNTLPPSRIKLALNSAQQNYKPVPLTDCNKAYPKVS